MSMHRVVLSVAIALGYFGMAYSENIQKCGVEDQSALEITAYNRGLSLVQDVRKITLPKGKGELLYEGVAAKLKPSSVHVKSLNNPPSFLVNEQSFEFDLMSPGKLLNNYVGQKMKIVDFNSNKDKKETVEAILLSNNRGGPIFKIGDEIYLGYPGTKVLPKLPGNLVTGPTLVWQYSNTAEGTQKIEVSYETAGISWAAEYVLVLDKDDISADLVSRINLVNRTGTTYRQAHFTFLAKKPSETEFRSPGWPPSEAGSDAGAPSRQRYDPIGPPQQPHRAYSQHPVQAGKVGPLLEDYYVYDPERPITSKDKQAKQISLVEANGIKVKKQYVVEGIGDAVVPSITGLHSSMPRLVPGNPWLAAANGGKGPSLEVVSEQRKAILKDFFTKRFVSQDRKQPVNILLMIRNSKENKLGLDLPAGTIRLYKIYGQSARRPLQTFLIKHTPANEEMLLKIGAARDVTAEILQTDYKAVSNRVHESEWEITLRNSKNEDVTVNLVEPLFGQWEILSSSHPYVKIDPFTIRFDVKVPKDQEIKVKYRLSLGL